jgi:Tfp pilus assembly protein PilF
MSRLHAPIVLTLLILAGAMSSGCATLSSMRRDLAEQPPKRKQRQEKVVAAFEAQRDAAQLEAALNRWNEGNHAACEQLLTSLVERKPQYVDARLQLAELHLFREETDPAEEQLRAALAIAPQRADLHDCLARVLEASERNSEAVVHFQKAAELDPNSELYRLAAAP